VSNKRLEIFHHLTLPPRGIFIQKLSLLDWGNTIHLICCYDPNSMLLFELCFYQCKQVNIEVFNDVPQKTELADIIAITLGKENFIEKATILTDCIEINILYRQLVIQPPIKNR